MLPKSLQNLEKSIRAKGYHSDEDKEMLAELKKLSEVLSDKAVRHINESVNEGINKFGTYISRGKTGYCSECGAPL